MTTIAYKDNILAYDSRITRSNVIVTDSCNKHKFCDGVHYFFAGASADIMYMIESYNEAKTLPQKSVEGSAADAFVVDNGELFLYEFAQGRFWLSPIELTRVDAIGSGCEFARGAMMGGASAEEAVRIAANCDIYTGGEIHTFKINQEG